MNTYTIKNAKTKTETDIEAKNVGHAMALARKKMGWKHYGSIGGEYRYYEVVPHYEIKTQSVLNPGVKF